LTITFIVIAGITTVDGITTNAAGERLPVGVELTGAAPLRR
jgi:hypothetical protein